MIQLNIKGIFVIFSLIGFSGAEMTTMSTTTTRSSTTTTTTTTTTSEDLFGMPKCSTDKYLVSFAAIMKALPLKQKNGVDIFGQIWEKFGAALILTFGHTV